jgi:cytoskeletal protein CcmA (bactofilin family)
MNKIIIILLIILILLLIINIYYRNKNYEKFGNTVSTLTPDQLLVITNLSPHLKAIKNLSDLATLLMNGSLTIPGGLKINGDLKVNGKTTCAGYLNANKNLIVIGGAKVNGDISFGGNLEVKGNTNLQKLVAGTTNFQNLKVLNDLGVEGDSNINKDLNVNGTITCKDSITASVLNAQKKLYINKFKFEQNEVEPLYLKDPSNMTLNLKQHDDFGIDKPEISFYKLLVFSIY